MKNTVITLSTQSLFAMASVDVTIAVIAPLVASYLSDEQLNQLKRDCVEEPADKKGELGAHLFHLCQYAHSNKKEERRYVPHQLSEVIELGLVSLGVPLQAARRASIAMANEAAELLATFQLMESPR